jgi:hypothetical protein
MSDEKKTTTRPAPVIRSRPVPQPHRDRTPGRVQWDDAALDPTKRKSVFEDPDGTENAKVFEGK